MESDQKTNHVDEWAGKPLTQKIAEALPLFIEREAHEVLRTWKRAWQDGEAMKEFEPWKTCLAEVFLKIEGLDRAIADLIILAEGHKETEEVMKVLSSVVNPILNQIPRRATVARAVRDLVFTRLQQGEHRTKKTVVLKAANADASEPGTRTNAELAN